VVTGERNFNLIVYVCNSAEKDVLLPAGTPFYAYFGERKYMNQESSQEQAQNYHVADIKAMHSNFMRNRK